MNPNAAKPNLDDGPDLPEIDTLLESLQSTLFQEMMGMIGDATGRDYARDYAMMPQSSQGCQETEWRGLPAKELFQAAHEGDADELRELLSQPKWRNMVNDLDNDGVGILHLCALSGDAYYANEIVDLLVGAGIDINRRSKQAKETALQLASIYSRVEYTEALLKHGARCDITDWKGSSPVPTARKICNCQHGNDKKCCQVLELLLESELKIKSDTKLQNNANKLRNSGNKAFGKGKYEEARELYTQSIELLEDHRTFANRALCAINIGQKLLKDTPLENYPWEIRMWGREAAVDAGKATTLDPTFVKAYYRQALAMAMSRDLPRAKSFVREGLESCPGNEQLLSLLEQLDDLNVPDHFSNPFACEQLNVELRNGADYLVCCYCMFRNPLPIEEGEDCKFCAMPFELCKPEIEEAMRSFILELN